MIVFEAPGVVLHHGDCIDVMRTLPAESVHAVITDPPYELGFMGKGWDASGIAYDVEMWRLAYAALKPGGFLLAFGGSRTWHRLAAAIEDAGFEMRDSIAWLYGSGFPKSMNVAAAIDKVRDDVADVRVVCRWLRDRIDEHPTLSIRAVAEAFGFHTRMVEHWAARDSDSQPTLPTLAQWDALRGALSFSDELDAEVYRLNMRKGEPGEAWADREVVGTVVEWENRTNYALTSRDGLKRGSTKNPDAEVWEGWGTALKPAFEPIVVARKPLIGTVARNVLEHGTGALNIDATRTGSGSGKPAREYVPNGKNAVYGSGMGGGEWDDSKGRWPTNVVLDESQAAELDKQTGRSTSPSSPVKQGGRSMAGGKYGSGSDMSMNPARSGEGVGYGDEGGASRFFPTFRYEAKAPGSERPDVDGVMHPTVKPLDLMRWLVRLVTPKDGTILEPFAGSGTTLEAAILEGFSVIGIEKSAEYLPLIEARITKPLQPAMFGDWEA